jgi:hypothetical protein
MSKAQRRQSDLDSLREERKANALPWSLSPFIRDSDLVTEPREEFVELNPDELRVRAPEEVPWIGNQCSHPHAIERTAHVLS